MLGGEIIPRSILFVELEDIPYVLCALGDGTLYTFLFSALNGNGESVADTASSAVQEQFLD